MSLNISGAEAVQAVAEILTPSEAATDGRCEDHPPGAYAMIVGDLDDQMIITGTLDQLRLIIGTLARQHNILSGRSNP